MQLKDLIQKMIDKNIPVIEIVNEADFIKFNIGQGKDEIMISTKALMQKREFDFSTWQEKLVEDKVNKLFEDLKAIK
jgi:hypothetical protein